MTDLTPTSDPDPVTAATDEQAAAFIDEVASRAAGERPGFRNGERAPVPAPNVADARRHLDQAWEHAAAGTEVPAEARMRQVKKAVLLAMRPVTSHQVHFNQQVSIAVKELAIAIDTMVNRVDHATGSLGEATTRVHAALATVEVTVDDLLGAVDRLGGLVAELAARTEQMEDELVAERAEVRTLRARQDVVLRTATGALGGKAEKRRLAELADELDDSAETLAEDLVDVTRGTRDEVRAELAELVADVLPMANLPLLDLGFGRGEWLELLLEHGLEATGVDASRRAVDAASRRGLTVSRGDAISHLAGLGESSIGAITAFHLVDRLRSDALVELLDRSLAALHPGGVLILSAANPTALDVGASELWIDPARRRPMHPQFLELLALSRGFGETDVRWLHPVDDALVVQPEDLAGIAPKRARVLAARLNQVLAGPRSFAVLARKAGTATSTVL